MSVYDGMNMLDLARFRITRKEVLTVQCAKCEAAPGAPCVGVKGQTRRAVHIHRYREVARIVDTTGQRPPTDGPSAEPGAETERREKVLRTNPLFQAIADMRGERIEGMLLDRTGTYWMFRCEEIEAARTWLASRGGAS